MNVFYMFHSENGFLILILYFAEKKTDLNFLKYSSERKVLSYFKYLLANCL